MVRDLWLILYSEFFRQCSSEATLRVMVLPDITAEESNSSARDRAREIIVKTTHFTFLEIKQAYGRIKSF
jgi:hypothetical protein